MKKTKTQNPRIMIQLLVLLKTQNPKLKTEKNFVFRRTQIFSIKNSIMMARSLKTLLLKLLKLLKTFFKMFETFEIFSNVFLRFGCCFQEN